MNLRRMAMMGALVAMSLSLGLLIRQRLVFGSPAGIHGVELRDGRKETGILMRLTEGSYLLQAADKCLILSPDEIARVDGQEPKDPGIPVASRVPRLQETFEEIRPGGEIDLHSTFRVANTGSKAVADVNWGIAPHEVASLSHYRVVDAFGNELPLKVADDPSINGKRVSVDLPRPALPGEEIQLTHIIDAWGHALRDGEAWVYRMGGDYPDDRLVTRTVRLPLGAEILAVHPEPLYQLVSADRKVVIWRRYFAKGEEIPWEIRYKL